MWGKKFKTRMIEELPIRLAHRVKELDELPNNLSKMPSIIKVKDWYAQSFQDLIELQTPQIPTTIKQRLYSKIEELPPSIPNPSLANIIKSQSSLHRSGSIGHR